MKKHIITIQYLMFTAVELLMKEETQIVVVWLSVSGCHDNSLWYVILKQNQEHIMLVLFFCVFFQLACNTTECSFDHHNCVYKENKEQYCPDPCSDLENSGTCTQCSIDACAANSRSCPGDIYCK